MKFKSRIKDQGTRNNKKTFPVPRSLFPVAGFTLIEVIVVIAIIALLSGYLLTYTGKSREQITLSVEETKLAQIIARSKSLAISTYGNPQAPCGYGVRMDYGAGAYALYRYAVSDCNSISVIDPADPGYAELQRYVLPQGILFEDGEAKLDAALFTPPDPHTFLWSGGAPLINVSGRVYLGTKDGSSHGSVSVSPAGQISF